MKRCYLCDCRLGKDYEQCVCCEHFFCYDCYSSIEDYFNGMPCDIQDELLGGQRYNSIICPCACDNSFICLSPSQMSDYVNSR